EVAEETEAKRDDARYLKDGFEQANEEAHWTIAEADIAPNLCPHAEHPEPVDLRDYDRDKRNRDGEVQVGRGWPQERSEAVAVLLVCEKDAQRGSGVRTACNIVVDQPD